VTTKKSTEAVEPAADVVAEPATPADFDDLLRHSSEEVLAEAPAEETPAQKKIRELEEALAAPAPEYTIAGKPETELTEDEKKIRDLEDRLAKKRAAEMEAAPLQYAEPAKGETLLIHFLEDGMTFSGQVWYRGQEVEFEVGGKAWEQQKDRNGKSWLDMVDDIDAQFARYGKQMFARGPWRGKPWGDFSHISNPEERAEAEAAALAEARRNRAAPVY
jgi:hypothetical protein